jgi:hypothetical protein
VILGVASAVRSCRGLLKSGMALDHESGLLPSNTLAAIRDHVCVP